MATIRIKQRTASTTVPTETELVEGELGYIRDTKAVYIGTDATSGNTPQIGGEVLDEDDMVSNSGNALSTQQSIKAYADTKASAGFAVAMAIAL